jgi:hypothetical protein
LGKLSNTETGGRIIIDILRSGEMPEEIRSNPAAYTG